MIDISSNTVTSLVEFAQIVSENQIVLALLVVVFAMVVVVVAEAVAARLKDSAIKYRVARIVTERFYLNVDVLLSSQDVPAQIKDALYGLLRAVTNSDVGREAFAAIVRRAKAVRLGQETQTPGPVAQALRALREKNPELAGQCAEAARDALCAILCAHDHRDRHISVEVQSQVNQQDELARLVEPIAQRIDGADVTPAAV